MVEVQGPAEIVIVTGISGAGRRTAAHTMEDLGWYVVDNLPPAMLPILVDRMGTAERLAVVVDVRSREEFEQLPTAFAEVKARGYRVTVLFLEASDDVIVQRQESNRRPLPLQYGGRICGPPPTSSSTHPGSVPGSSPSASPTTSGPTPPTT